MSTQPRNPSIDLNALPENSNSSHESSRSPPHCLHIDLNQIPEVCDTLDNNLHSHSVESTVRPIIKKKILSSEQKRAVFESLLLEQEDGKLPRGIITKVANSFSICERSISRIWNEGKYFCHTIGHAPIFSNKFLNRTCRKRVEIDFDKIKNIPFHRRTNIRSLSNDLGMSKSTVHRRVKDGSLRPHSNPIKPYLLDDNKRARLEFCLSMVNEGTISSTPTFIDMHNQIHIDEKWFYISKTSQKYYLHPNENEPLRTCKSKRFIPKIMFLAAVARPRFDVTTGELFNGKIGIWPFVSHEPAKRNSKNRLAGTMEMKPILSVNKDVIRSCIIQKLIPAIKEKWPRSSSGTIYVQQDNARPHLDINDLEFVTAANTDGFDIRLYYQPPNSPDMNVLDLGFFRAIDSIQHQEAPSTVEDFVVAIENAFNKFTSEELNNVFLILQSCMVEVMKRSDDNDYKIPHMNKHKLMKNGQLPNCIEFETEILDIAKEALTRY